jgi:HTH-type transcriptional regulator/antitoxin HigA
MTEMNRHAYETLAELAPDWANPPGETILDLLEEKGWTQADFAARMGYTTKHVHLLMKGQAPITEDTARRLERVLGSTARFWMNLELQYREHVMRQQSIADLEQDVDWLEEIPLRDMIRFGWVEKAADKWRQVFACLRFFGVASVAAWRDRYVQPVSAYRASSAFKSSASAVSTWIRFGEREAERMECEEYDAARFQDALQTARAFTLQKQLDAFLHRLTSLCAAAGVALVIAPTPAKCPISGCAKWVSSDKALIMLSLRGKTDDKFWFTFFHEAGHLLKHGKKLTFLDDHNSDGLNPAEEREADAFAADMLIDPSAYHAFCAAGRFSASDVSAFAKQQGVSPGIVVGRLQFDHLLPWTHLNGLKAEYVLFQPNSDSADAEHAGTSERSRS